MANAAVYVIDENGFELARHAAAALLMSQTGFDDLYVFCHNFEPRADDPLIEIGRTRGVRVRLETIETRLALGERRVLSAHLSKTAYLKFEAVRSVARLYERILYVDHDILFFEDMGFGRIAFDGFPVAAVYDIAEISGLTDPAFAENCRKNNRSPHFFNTGVMLFDGTKWNDSWEADYAALYERHNAQCDYKVGCRTRDQCLFNIIFENNWKRLPLEFNMQVCAKFGADWACAPVRHFQGPHKFLPVHPWRNDARDIGLLRRVGEALGSGTRYSASGFMYALNAVRNAPRVRRAKGALALARQMLVQPFPASAEQG